jgi:hypothetical protein
MATVGACSDPTGLGEATFESDRLSVLASLSPSSIPRGGTAEVVVVIHNRDGVPLQLSAGVGCLLFLRIVEMPSLSSVSMDGASFGCSMAPHFWTIAAGDSLTWSTRVAAQWDGRAMRPGRYLAEVDFITTPEVPLLHVLFVVR